MTAPATLATLATLSGVINNILKTEAGYVNHPSDKGGETNFGITLAVARSNGYTGSMRDMSVDFARSVYLKRYVIDPGFDKIYNASHSVGAKVIDIGVNMGPKWGGLFLQRALNLLNKGETSYGDIKVDGDVGPDTVSKLSRFISIRKAEGESVLVKIIGILQGARYVEIAEGNNSQEDFIYGWVKNRV